MSVVKMMPTPSLSPVLRPSDIQPEEQDVLSAVQAMMEQALHRLGYPPQFFEVLKEPVRILSVRISVLMDNGETKVFNGYRVQHNDAIGPVKGGIRFHPTVNLPELAALSIWMSIKCGILGLPYGGAYGGVVCDPIELSFGEQERLARGYVRAVSQIVGPTKDIPAPDVNTNSQVMAWMLDEYSRLRESASPGFITGKPLVLGGSHGRNEATALGVCAAVREAAARQKRDLKDLRVLIQGFGNVGSNVAKLLYDLGAKVVGVSDAKGGIYDSNGLDIPTLLDQRDSFGRVTTDYVNVIDNKEFLLQSCDVLIPAALGNQIHSGNADAISASIIVEGANGATTEAAERILQAKGVTVIPDILANAGGVTVSYFEWVQNQDGRYWSEREVTERMEGMVVRSIHHVLDTAKRYQVSVRQAAYMTGLRPFAEAIRWRGWVH